MRAGGGPRLEPMPLHLVKLCVGVSAIEELDAWIAERLAGQAARGAPAEHKHTTRMVPRRVAELLDGGSLYWVIKGNIQARQRLTAIRPFVDRDGIQRCDLVLAPELVATVWQPRRAFQGWRYLDAGDAPADLAPGQGAHALPVHLRLELADLGLL
ncbi:MAG: lysophospholipase [Alphaproteobacteria bacterium]|nr:MAG: lysophospholipase [Alphaproteobacteria bacterium]